MPVLGSLNDIKQGLTINYNGKPCLVVEAKFVRMQQRKPVMQTKLRNLINNKVVEYSFKAGERVETMAVERKKVNFLYAAGTEYSFMDNDSYEQFTFTKESLGDKTQFLKDGCEVVLIYVDGQPINVELPVKMDFKVTETPEGSKGDTAQGRVTKQATLETGAVVNVPMFVKEGDMIKINTDTGDYVERVN